MSFLIDLLFKILFRFIGGVMIGSGSYVFFTDEVNFFKSMMVMGVGCIILSLEDIKDRIKEPEI